MIAEIDAPPRRVAIFRNQLLPGSETFIRNQALALRQWHPVFVGSELIADGILPASAEANLIAPARGWLEWSDRGRFWLERPIPRARKAFASMEVDLVHAHFGTDATMIWPSVQHAGLPMLVTLHGYDINIARRWWESGGGGLRGRLYPGRFLRMARHPNVRFVAVSQAIRRRAIELGVPEGKIVVHYIGIDCNLFKPDDTPLVERRRRILFVGRMVEKKGPLTLIRAYSQLLRAVPDAELVMAGDGPLLDAAKALAAELGTSVQFLGRITPAEVRAQMGLARVFCLPSLSAANGDAEGFGLVILEAQACGVPVVTSARGGANEGLLDGLTGYAFPEGDTEKLSWRLLELLTDDARWAEFSRAAADFVRTRFDVAELTPALEATYSDVVCGHVR